ncbi:MAG TPA: radical SAM protein [Spirochaetia bacterium]|nr:radical SAM protein [Spirochaetia bacterium]
MAQDLASYGADRGGSELPDLLREIGGLNGDFWLRLLYLHPDRFPMEILSIMRKDPRLLPYFDIPLQHASGSVLRAMGRKGSSDTYLELVRRIRDSVPNAVIRSTFLVGFPGETESDFESLMDFQSKAQLDWLGIFVYSPEEGTPAFKMDGSVRRETAEERRSCLERAQIAITNRRLDRLVGESFPVLIEEPVLKEDYYLGRGYPHAPDVDGLVLLKGRGFKSGDLVPARILKRNGFDLEAVSERDHGKMTG